MSNHSVGMKYAGLAGLLLIFFCTGCSTTYVYKNMFEPSGVTQTASHIKTELFFRLEGRGPDMSEEEWGEFLDTYVTPRFEQNVMVVDVTEQYMGKKGRVRSRAKVLVCLHENTAVANASIEYVRSCFARTYGDNRTVRISTPVTVSFRESLIEANARQLGELANKKIDESSGLAMGLRNPQVLWTHNDSGGKARIFALDLTGSDLGTYDVAGAVAEDWEDICSFSLDGKYWLLIADFGDNEEVRDDYCLYLIEEPVAGEGLSTSVPVVRKINFKYEDGLHNCESIAVDISTRKIYLVTKSWEPVCGVYEIPLDIPGSNDVFATATKIAELRLPRTVAMDISPDGMKAVILTYGDAYEYVRTPGEDWALAFSREPRMLPMPYRRQGESICYSRDGGILYLTSEQLPAPVWEVMQDQDNED